MVKQALIGKNIINGAHLNSPLNFASRSLLSQFEYQMFGYDLISISRGLILSRLINSS
jgi:hypothetical protein